MGPLLIASLVASLLGLPIAAWLDLRALSERMLKTQASEISRIIDEVRGFYGSDVVGRILPATGSITVTHNYRDMAGAVPIPATLSIELGKRISGKNDGVKYRFVSDLPFKGRENHDIDGFEQDALTRLRADPKQSIMEVSGSLLERRVRTAAPVIMGPFASPATTFIPTAPSRTGRSAMFAASRKSRSPSRSPPTFSRSNTCSPTSLSLPPPG